MLLTIIVLILLSDYLLERYLNFLNSKHRSTQLPMELQGIYDEEKYQKSLEYDKVNSKFSFYTSTFSLLLMLLMLLFNGFSFVENLVKEYAVNPIGTALLFFGLLFFVSDILGIPFSVYHTFVIEEKFGFNRTTIKTFCFDKLKGYLLTGILGGLLLSLFVLFYQWVGHNFWIYAWLLACVVLLFTTMFYASWIMPLFNKFTPLPDGELRNAIVNYCKKAGFELDNLFVMDGSKRSSKANAFFSGLGKKKRIVLYDTLISNHTVEELVAVLAHEIGHYKKKHSQTHIILSILQTGIMLFLLSWFIDSPVLSQALGATQSSFQLNLLVFGLLFTPISLIIGIFMNILSRKNEYEADHFAAETADGKALQDALKKLSVNNLSNLTPHPLYVFFHYSHPSLLERLKKLEKCNVKEC